VSLTDPSIPEALGRRVATRAGEVWFDDVRDEDLDAIADYFTKPDAHLDTLIDRTRMPDKAGLRARYALWKRTGDPGQMNSVFALRLASEASERLIGFTNLLRQTERVNYSHWHILDPNLRAGGISSAVYPTRLDLYFGRFPIERLIHQTRITNTGVNRMLDKFVPIAKTEFVERPDGLAKPGEFHMRYVTRADLPRIRAIGEQLARP
jgi:RimJ/RimL family protein N-acetyltransferase